MTIKDIRPALRTFLLADSAISAAVGGVRIYPIKLPAGVPAGPAIVYSLISEQNDYHMQGPSGLVAARFQIDAWALTSDLASSLAILVKARLGGYLGPMVYGTNSPKDYITVRGVFVRDASFNFDAVAVLHRASRDYMIHFAER